MDTEPKRRGRKTKEEEAEEYLRAAGIDPTEIMETARARSSDRSARKSRVEVPDDDKMLEEFKRELYYQMESGDLKSTALVNALRAIAIIAESSRHRETEEEGTVRELSEVLADAALPVERRREIGREELQRLHASASSLELVLAGIKEEE